MMNRERSCWSGKTSQVLLKNRRSEMKKSNIEGGKLLELEFKTKTAYRNSFADIDVNCTFISPSKREVSISAFYDGDSPLSEVLFRAFV